MKSAVKFFSVLAMISLVAFAPKSSKVHAAPSHLDAKVVSMTKVLVLKSGAGCYQLSTCDTGQLLYADYTGTAPFSVANHYDIYYYTGGPCDIVVASVEETGPC